MHYIGALAVADQHIVLVWALLGGFSQVLDDVQCSLNLAVFFKRGWVVNLVACYAGDEGLGGFVDWVANDNAVVLDDGLGCTASFAVLA